MKLLVDMNLSPDWVPVLKGAGWEAVHYAVKVRASRGSPLPRPGWSDNRGRAVRIEIGNQRRGRAKRIPRDGVEATSPSEYEPTLLIPICPLALIQHQGT